MKLFKSISAVLLAACLIPFVLSAQSEDSARKGKGGDRADRIAKIRQMDANGDGIISRDEAENSSNPERAQRMFDHLDSDGDGLITESERRAAREQFMGQGGKGPGGKKDRDSSCSSCQK